MTKAEQNKSVVVDPGLSVVVDKPEAIPNYDPFYYKFATVKILHFSKNMETKDVMSFVKKEWGYQGQIVRVPEKLLRQNPARTPINRQRGREVH